MIFIYDKIYILVLDDYIYYVVIGYYFQSESKLKSNSI